MAGGGSPQNTQIEPSAIPDSLSAPLSMKLTNQELKTKRNFKNGRQQKMRSCLSLPNSD